MTVAGECLAAHRRGLHDDEDEGPYAQAGATLEALFMLRVCNFLKPT